jgi:uroporphyrinogen decarboxylase
MNERHRFLRTMRYEGVDRPPWIPPSLWVDTRTRWEGEGLPAGMSVCDYLQIPDLRFLYLGPETGVFPHFQETILSRDGRFITGIDKNGITYRREDRSSSMPEYVDFPIKTPRDLETFMEERFSPDRIDERYPGDWEQRIALGSDPDRRELTFVDGGCIYGWLRRLAGVETCSLLFCEEPALVDRFLERVHTIAMHGLERVLSRTTPDYIGFGEDIAFRTSTLISPAMFRRFLLPRYKAACDYAAARGLDCVWYDSDGCLYPLMDLYLEAGVNGFAPLEVAAGMHPVEVRRRFGKEVRMIGGFDKRILAGDKPGIAREVERLRPLIEGGGYIPACDHHVPPDVSLENYAYFIHSLQGTETSLP